MKVNIKHTHPIIGRKSYLPDEKIKFSIEGWEVQGTYCHEGTVKDFDINIPISELEMNQDELKELIKERLI